MRYENSINRSNLKQLLQTQLEGFAWSLYDVLESNGETFAILKIPLKEYRGLILKINNTVDLSTFSSSGKIKLVRQRINSVTGEEPLDSV